VPRQNASVWWHIGEFAPGFVPQILRLTDLPGQFAEADRFDRAAISSEVSLQWN
jgi:hypothetical protein